MSQEIEARAEDRSETENLVGPTEVAVRGAQITAQEVEIGDLIRLEEVTLNLQGVEFRAGPGPIRIQEANARLVINEVSLNRMLARKPDDALRTLQAAILNGKIRISGKYSILGLLPVPFAFTAVPEIEGGARLRLD